MVEQGMDIAAGYAICHDNKNHLGNAYIANIQETWLFQIFGQGLTQCHPHMLELI
jgi:acyl-CoA dehydrogenase